MALFDAQPAGSQPMAPPQAGGMMGPPSPQDNEAPSPSSPNEPLDRLKAIADNILYDDQGIQTIKDLVSKHSKDISATAALLACSLLFQMRDKISDLNPDDIMGPNGVAVHIIDSIYEILQNLKVKVSKQDFKKSYDMVEETYENLTGTQEPPDQEANEDATSGGGLFQGVMQ